MVTVKEAGRRHSCFYRFLEAWSSFHHRQGSLHILGEALGLVRSNHEQEQLGIMHVCIVEIQCGVNPCEG